MVMDSEQNSPAGSEDILYTTKAGEHTVAGSITDGCMSCEPLSLPGPSILAPSRDATRAWPVRIASITSANREGPPKHACTPLWVPLLTDLYIRPRHQALLSALPQGAPWAPAPFDWQVEPQRCCHTPSYYTPQGTQGQYPKHRFLHRPVSSDRRRLVDSHRHCVLIESLPRGQGGIPVQGWGSSVHSDPLDELL